MAHYRKGGSGSREKKLQPAKGGRVHEKITGDNEEEGQQVQRFTALNQNEKGLQMLLPTGIKVKKSEKKPSHNSEVPTVERGGGKSNFQGRVFR